MKLIRAMQLGAIACDDRIEKMAAQRQLCEAGADRERNGVGWAYFDGELRKAREAQRLIRATSWLAWWSVRRKPAHWYWAWTRRRARWTWLRTTVGRVNLAQVASFEVWPTKPWANGAELAERWAWQLVAQLSSDHKLQVVVAFWNDRDQLLAALDEMLRHGDSFVEVKLPSEPP